MLNTGVNYKIINEYTKTTVEMLSLSFPSIPKSELRQSIEWSVQKRFVNNPVELYNNYTEKRMESTILDITEYILDRKPIITAYGVLYSRKGTVVNPIAKRIQGFLDDRDKLKKEMFKYPKGSEEREYRNLLQLLKKLDANGFYGIFGQSSCLFFNLHSATAITTQGRSLISSAGMFFEGFLADNYKFSSLDELITFIYNVKSEAPTRKYIDEQMIDEDVSVLDCFTKIISMCGFNYIPDNEDMDIIWDIITNLDRVDRNRVYYKNNLYAFMENKTMTNAITYIMKTMQTPFIVPEAKGIPKEISVEVNEFCDILMEYVYYSHQIIDHYERFENMVRATVIITDTDSQRKWGAC